MRQYIFRDTDITGTMDLDILGDDYTILMEACFRYCASVSFRVHPYIGFPARLLSHRLPISDNVDALYCKIGKMGIHNGFGILPYLVGHFRLTDEVKDYILHESNTLFGWIDDNPEDIAFYRSDGSVFLHSCTHNGMCTLTPRDDEAISEIVSNQLWIKID